MDQPAAFVPQEPVLTEPENVQTVQDAETPLNVNGAANGNGHYQQQEVETPPYTEPQSPQGRRVYHVPPQQQPAQRDATLTIKVPQARVAQMMNSQGATTQVNPEILSRSSRYSTGRPNNDSAYLDQMISDPESLGWELSVNRFLPIALGGRNFPAHDIMRIPIMPLNELRQQIIKAWGGGDYRVAIMYTGSENVVTNKRTVTISINQSQFPPRFEMDDSGGDTLTGTATESVAEPESQQALETRRRIKSAELEIEEQLAIERQETGLLRARKAKLNRLREEQQVIKMEKELNGNDEQKNAQVEMLKVQLAAIERQSAEAIKQAEDRRKDDEKRRDDLRIIEEKRRDDQRAADKAQIEATNQMFMKGLETLAASIKAIAVPPAPTPDRMPEMIVALATALKPAALPPPPPPAEDKGMVLAIELMKNNTAQVTAAAANEKQLMYKMMDIASKPPPQSTTVADAMMLMERGEKNVQKTIELVQNSLAGNEDEAQSSGGAGWQDVLKQIALEAAKTPAVAALLTKLIGTANPSDQQIAQTAAMWERQGAPPQAYAGMGMPPPVQQLPGIQQGPPSLDNARPVYAQQPPQQRQMQQMQGAGQPPPVRQQPMSPQQQAAYQNHVRAQQAAVANQAQAQAAQGQPVQVQIAPNQESELRLREAVTESMMICCEAFEDRTKASKWVEHADENWHEGFKRVMLLAPSHDARTNMISRLCDPQVITRIAGLMTSDTTGATQARFYQEMDQFLKLQEHLRNPGPPAMQTPIQVTQSQGPVINTQPPLVHVDPAMADVAAQV